MGMTPASRATAQSPVSGRSTPRREHKAKRRAPNTLVWTQPRTIPPDMQRSQMAARSQSPVTATHEPIHHDTQKQQQQQQQQQPPPPQITQQLTPPSMLSRSSMSPWDSDTMHMDLGDTTDLTDDFCIPDLMQSPALSKASTFPQRTLLSNTPLSLTMDDLGGIEGIEASKWTPPASERDSSLEPADVKGFNAVHLAAYYGQHSIMRLLLSACPEDTDAVNDKGQSALHIAAAEGQTEVVRELLDLGANAFLQDHDGQTVLHAAASSGSIQTVLLLLDRDPGMIRVPDSTGHTPLHRAVMQGNEEVIRSLLKRGADPRTTIA